MHQVQIKMYLFFAHSFSFCPFETSDITSSRVTYVLLSVCIVLDTLVLQMAFNSFGPSGHGLVSSS
jgi:hypothetical protein